MSVFVRYKAVKEYCSCCSQELPKPKMSGYMEIEITKENALRWSDNWGEIVKYPEDVEGLVPEFVHEFISFWAADSNEKVILEQSEINKVHDFIMREFSNSDSTESTQAEQDI